MTTEQHKTKATASGAPARRTYRPIIVPADIDQLQRMANMMAASGFFQDARDNASVCEDCGRC